MRRFFSRIVICVFCAGTAACGARVTAPPTKPQLPAEASSHGNGAERPPPKLVAPPPAYGNKVVVVRSAGEPRTL